VAPPQAACVHSVQDRIEPEVAASRLAAIVDSSDDAIIGKSLDGVIESWNRGAEQIYGYSAKEAIGQPVSLLIPPDHFDEVPGLLEQVRRGEKVDHYESVRVRNDGTVVDVSLTISPIKNEAGDIIGASTIARDITQRKQWDEPRFRALLEAAPIGAHRFIYEKDAIVIVDSRGRITLVNAQTEDLFGWAREELNGKPVEMLVPRFEGVHVANRQGTDPHTRPMGAGLELFGLRKGGSEFPVEISLSPFDTEEGVLVSAAIRDVTARVRAEDKLKRLAARLSESNRELEDFASIASHDLQEPLRKILAFGDRLKEREGERVTDQGRDDLDRIEGAVHRMKVVLDDLLAYSRVTRKAKPFTSCDLGRAVQEVLSDLEPSIQQARAHVEIGDLPTIEADPPQIRRLLQNLVSNSLKFARADEPPVVRIYDRILKRDGKHSPQDPAGCCQILVEDNGIGFEEKYADRIFTIFQRLHGRGDYEGAGMGLAICKKIANFHSGDITAKSSPGEGSTFIVTVPVRQTRERRTE
jgi:two-component system, LuxR family, sensor kinase FixL